MTKEKKMRKIIKYPHTNKDVPQELKTVFPLAENEYVKIILNSFKLYDDTLYE